MRQHYPSSLSPLTWLGTILLTAVAFSWSIGLIGQGIGELGGISASKSTQTLSQTNILPGQKLGA